MPCSTDTRATAITSREAMTRNGSPPRPSCGSSSWGAVNPLAPTTRRTAPSTACTSAPITPMTGRGLPTTRLYPSCRTTTPYRALCRAVRMTSRGSLPTRTGNTPSPSTTATAYSPISALQAPMPAWASQGLGTRLPSAPPEPSAARYASPPPRTAYPR